MKRLFTLLIFFTFSCLSAFSQGGSYLMLNGKPLTANGIIELFPGDTMRLVFSPTPFDPADSLLMKSNIDSVLPGATFTASNSLHQIGYFNWIPGASDVSLTPSSFSVSVKVPGNPLTSIFNYIFQVRVNKPGSITSNNARVDLNQEIVLQPGTPMNLRFSSVNPALPDSIKITTTATSVLTGATFNRDNAKQQTADISWIPTASQVNSQPYLFTVSYQDNAPVPKQYVYTIRVRVSNVMGVKEELSINSFYAYPNPFIEKLNFKMNNIPANSQLVVYNGIGQEVDRISLGKTAQLNQTVAWEKASRMPAGTYLVRVISENSVIQAYKLIKY